MNLGISSLVLAGATVVAWLVHGGLVSLYIDKFANTKALGFRLFHVLEISIVVCLMLFIYLKSVNPAPSTASTAIIILGVLIVVDFILLLAMPSIRQKFDAWHFAAAYTVILSAIFLISRLVGPR